jgi:cell wall-associated NlpC family hydrolase
LANYSSMVKKVIVFLLVSLVFTTALAYADSSYTIKAGDTLWDIANRYNTSVEALYKINPQIQEDGVLNLGDKILIPDSKPAREVIAVIKAKKGKDQTKTYVYHKPKTLASRRGIFVAKLLRTASRYLGTPYAFGGTSGYGFDCSGFVSRVFGSNGVSLARAADEQYQGGQKVAKADLQPGDLVFFSTYTSGVSHVGIYVGNNKFIHSSSSRGVSYSSLNDSYYGSRYVGARRY